jgi:hypothetical protein
MKMIGMCVQGNEIHGGSSTGKGRDAGGGKRCGKSVV